MAGVPAFPAWKVEFGQPLPDSGNFVGNFLNLRQDDSWLLLTGSVVASDRHLWAAWISLVRRIKNDSMRSKGQDGEFLRLIAGTHHISQGFRRAGLFDGDEGGWLIHLPKNDGDGSLPKLDYEKLSKDARSLAENLDCQFLEGERPLPNRTGLIRLGVFDEESEVYVNLEDSVLEDYFIAHIHTSDING